MTDKETIYDLVKAGDYVLLEKRDILSVRVTTGEVLESNDAGMRICGLKLTIRESGTQLQQLLSPLTEITDVSEHVLEFSPGMQISNDPDELGTHYLGAVAVLQDDYRPLIRERDYNAVCNKAKTVVTELVDKYGSLDKICKKNNPIDDRRLRIAQEIIEEFE